MIYLICGEKMERVQKVIANRGYTSRRNAEKLIEEGKVKVKFDNQLGDFVIDPDGQTGYSYFINNIEKIKERI